MNRFKRFTTFATLLLTLAMAAAASATPWKFAVTCDSRSSYYNDAPLAGPDGIVPINAAASQYYDATTGISPFFKNVASALSKETGIDFVLFPGDIARGKKPVPTDTQFKAAIVEWNNQIKPVIDAGIPVYTIRGNHDAYGPNAASPAATLASAKTTWLDNIVNPAGSTQDPAQSGLTFSFTHKGSLFVGLDEYPTGTVAPTGYDSAFLKAQLATKSVQHKFVFAHQPVWNYKSDELGPAGLADDMNNGGVDLYFSGHVHSYQRIAKTGYNFQEMIVGTGGAPQDFPTLVSGSGAYVPDPALRVLNYAGGTSTSASFGYAIITVNDDGTLTTEMKFLADPYSTTSAVTGFDKATLEAKPWKFAVMADTQWLTPPGDDGKNPNTVSVDIINHLNTQFINQGVKLVIQTGDLEDSYSTTNMSTTAVFRQALYNAGIGFYTLRGNHESTNAAANDFVAIFPQTTNALMNATPASAFLVLNNDAATQPFPAKTGLPFKVGTISATPVAPTGFTGLNYAVDYNNARFVFLDQFTPTTTGTSHSVLDDSQVTWVNGQLSGRPANTHAFVYGHKALISQNHTDGLFGLPSDQPTRTDNFIKGLMSNGVRIYMGGHDHMHNRANVASTDHTASVQDIVMASNSNKFYIPYGTAGYTKRTVTGTTVSGSGNLTVADPTQTNDYIYNVLVAGKTTRETPLSQELYTVGYYIYTVNGPEVTAEYYSANVNAYNSNGEYMINATPTMTFSKRETFGYSLNGKEYLVPQAGPNNVYTVINETHNTTTAKVLNGANSSTATDSAARALTKSVNTGWTDRTDYISSDIFTVNGMADLGAAAADTFVLSMSYDSNNVTPAQIAGGSFGLATSGANGLWVNAVAKNNGGVPTFVQRAWTSGDLLGTFGVDTATKTAWAVVNHNSNFTVAKFPTALTDAKVNTTGFLYSRATQKYVGTMTVTNNGTTTLTGPFVVVFNGLTTGVNLDNATGIYNGNPHIDFSATTLAPGASLTFPLTFTNPGNAFIKFTPVTFQGQ